MNALVVPFFADVDVLFVADKSIYKTSEVREQSRAKAKQEREEQA